MPIPFLIFALIYFTGCQDKMVYNTFKFSKSHTISDVNGIPKDSSSFYFPVLFCDLTQTKDYQASNFRVDSYLLFKMNEPILSNYYLNKETYRIIALRSMHRPIVIRIDKYADSIIVTVKKINRKIGYPFLVYAVPDCKRTMDQKIKDEHNVKKYNNTNYFNELYFKMQLKTKQFDSITNLLDSSRFWQNKSNYTTNTLQIDGSNWIIEGQNKFDTNL